MTMMHSTLSCARLPRLLGGHWLIPPPDSDCILTGAGDDSRHLRPGMIFAAITGELTDGHRYIEGAVAAGARAIVVQKEPSQPLLQTMRTAGVACLQVADSLCAYQQLARLHRLDFPDLPVLAVTGSCGKTSTKEMCAAILAAHFHREALKTEGSTNNHFGVPRNLLRIDARTPAAVIELGTNHPGEIAVLTPLVTPTVALVSNIGHAHLEFFHDLRGVASEKGDIFACAPETATAIYPDEAEGADILCAKAGTRRCLTFGTTPHANLQVHYAGYAGTAFQFTLRWNGEVPFSGEQRTVDWAVGGAHMALNAAAAAAAATAMGCTPDEIAAGLSRCMLPEQRQELRHQGNNLWINDAFNANPDSMRAAIDYFAQNSPAGKKQYLILGDMLELGPESTALHRSILTYARRRCPQAQLITIGPIMAQAAESLGEDPARQCVADTAAARQLLLQDPPDNACLLLKSSHGIGVGALCPPAHQ